jgi:hypothetical protein
MVFKSRLSVTQVSHFFKQTMKSFPFSDLHQFPNPALLRPPTTHLPIVPPINVPVTEISQMRLRAGGSRPSTLRRSGPSRRSNRRPSSAADPDLDEVRDYLAKSRDFGHIFTPKLLSTHDHMPNYLRTCIVGRDFGRATAGDRFRQDLQLELHRESELPNSRPSLLRPVITSSMFTRISPQFISLFEN